MEAFFWLAAILVGLVTWGLVKLKSRLNREMIEHQVALDLSAGHSLLGLNLQARFQALLVSSGSFKPRNWVKARFAVPFLRKTGLRFAVFPKGSTAELGPYATMQDIAIGDPNVDRWLSVRGNDEARLKSLFANPRIQDLLVSQQFVRLEICEDQNWLGSNPWESTEQLCLTVDGVITSSSRLEAIYALLQEVLRELDVLSTTEVAEAETRPSAQERHSMRSDPSRITAGATLPSGQQGAEAFEAPAAPDVRTPTPELTAEPSVAQPVPAAVSPPLPGSQAARLVVLEGPRPGREFTLDKVTTTIGRSIANEVVLEDDKLSYQHARILRQEGGWQLQDVMDSGGTYLNGELLSAPRELREGDVIGLGDTRLAFGSAKAPEPGQPEAGLPTQDG